MKRKATIVAAGMAILVAVASAMALIWLDDTPAEVAQEPARNESEGAAIADGEPSVDWDYWHSVNSDICAWVTIPGTGIDYPVVAAQAAEPEYYLGHNVNQEGDDHGAVYLDADCKSGMDSPNAIILGHHMNDGTMLSEIANYHDREYAESHKMIEITMPDETRTLEVTSVWTIPGTLDAKRSDFVNEQDFAEYKERCYRSSSVKLAGADDACDSKKRLYTFCTCSYYETPENERTLVFARQVD